MFNLEKLSISYKNNHSNIQILLVFYQQLQPNSYITLKSVFHIILQDNLR